MFPKPKNERLAIGTFVGVLALDAILASAFGGGHGGLVLFLLAVNFPGIVLISVFAPLLTRFDGEASGVLVLVILVLFSAAFWSYIFGYVFRFKRVA